MNRTKRWMSLLLAFVMVFAFAIPTAFAADGDTNVIIHKVVMSKEQMEVFDPSKEYDPSQPIQDLKNFFGNTAKEVNGVVFEFYREGKYTGMIPNEGATADRRYTTGQADPVVIPAGTYLMVEKHSESTYVGEDGKQLTGMKAVPQIITLPYVNEGGNIETLHLYPKNTEEKPDIVKGFEGLPEDTERDYNVGDTVPYEVSTTIPVNAKYATFFWEDKMSDGLTFDRNLVITSSGEAFAATDDYRIVYQNDAGFRVALTDTGLAKINNKTTETTITLKYSATLNEDAVIDGPETNDIKLQYGNRPYTGNTPIPTTPTDGKIKVTKSWADGTPPANVTVIVDLYETMSGKRVATVELNAGNNWTHTFTDLDDNLQYTVIERLISGYDASYAVEQNGQVTVTNKKNDNPPVLNPEEPKVYTGGKKFIKVDASDANKVLPGAEFVVYRVDGGEQEFLKLKDADQQTDELNAYTEAQKAYIDAINAFNADPTSTTQAQIDALKEARDEAFEAMNMQWKWDTDQAGAFVFVSDQQGNFEVTGLAYGTYFLKEIKAPAGYALRPNDLEFAISKGSYGDTLATHVPNSKVTIPQTGGMGTVAFGVVGAALMGGALLGLKRKKANEDQ